MRLMLLLGPGAEHETGQMGSVRHWHAGLGGLVEMPLLLLSVGNEFETGQLGWTPRWQAGPAVVPLSRLDPRGKPETAHSGWVPHWHAELGDPVVVPLLLLFWEPQDDLRQWGWAARVQTRLARMPSLAAPDHMACC